MENETVKHFGDKKDLAYIRDRYNYLLELKQNLQAAIRHSRYTGTDLALLLETQAELLRVDEARTGMLNPHGLYVDTDNIQLVTRRKPLESNWQLLLENKIPGERRGRDKRFRELKQIAQAGKIEQKHLIKL